MDKDTYPWEVYTQKDIQMNSSRIGTPHHHPTTYNRKVGSQNTSKSNKNSVSPFSTDASLHWRKPTQSCLSTRCKLTQPTQHTGKLFLI